MDSAPARGTRRQTTASREVAANRATRRATAHDGSHAPVDATSRRSRPWATSSHRASPRSASRTRVEAAWRGKLFFAARDAAHGTDSPRGAAGSTSPPAMRSSGAIRAVGEWWGQQSTYPIADIVPGPTSSPVEEALPPGGLLFPTAAFEDLLAVPLAVPCDGGVCGVEEGRCWGSHPTQTLREKWKSPAGSDRLDVMGEVALPRADAASRDHFDEGARAGRARPGRIADPVEPWPTCRPSSPASPSGPRSASRSPARCRTSSRS